MSNHTIASHVLRTIKKPSDPHHLLQLRRLITERVAVKIIDKGKLDSKTHRMVSREIQITDALSHPHLIRFVSQLLRNVIYVMKFLLTFFYPISNFHASRYTKYLKCHKLLLLNFIQFYISCHTSDCKIASLPLAKCIIHCVTRHHSKSLCTKST